MLKLNCTLAQALGGNLQNTTSIAMVDTISEWAGVGNGVPELNSTAALNLRHLAEACLTAANAIEDQPGFTAESLCEIYEIKAFLQQYPNLRGAYIETVYQSQPQVQGNKYKVAFDLLNEKIEHINNHDLNNCLECGIIG